MNNHNLIMLNSALWDKSKKILRVITRVHISENLMIIPLASLLDMDNLDCIGQNSSISATYEAFDLG